MARVRLFAVALVCVALLVSAGEASPQSQLQPQPRVAIEQATVAPIDAALKREAGALCADFVPSVAEELVRGSAAGGSCEAAAASVFAATASGDPGVTVLEYAKPAVKRLDVAGTHATVTFTAEYTISTHGVSTATVRFELFGPQRVQLEDLAGVWRVSSPATLAAVCLHSDCAAGASELLFSYGEPQMIATTLVAVPAAVRRAGGAEERQFKEGSRVAAQSGCLACHKIGEHGNRGPGQNLTHVGASLSEREIAHVLEDPRAPMPSFRHLPAAKLRALVRFLSLLRGTAAKSSTAHAASVRDGRCVHAGQVLARDRSVVVWKVTSGRRSALYACVTASGVVHPVVHAGPSTTGVLLAGPDVAFDYDSAEDRVLLDVFDASTGHTELRHVIGNVCLSGGGGSDNVCGADPWMLAPTGWVAVLDTQGDYPEIFPGNASSGSLLALNGRYTVTNLDGEATEDMRLSGSTLTWTIVGGTRYSAPLDSQLDALGAGTVPPPTPLPQPCSLLTAADAQSVLGPVSPGSPFVSTGCAYTSTGTPSVELTLALEADPSPAQTTAAKLAAYRSESYFYTGPPDYNQYTWTADWDTASGGLAHVRVVRFVGDVELTVQLTTLDPSNALDGSVGPLALNWNAGEAAIHFTDLAFDRLMGLDVVGAGGD